MAIATISNREPRFMHPSASEGMRQELNAPRATQTSPLLFPNLTTEDYGCRSVKGLINV
jgi:hypothetical protein